MSFGLRVISFLQVFQRMKKQGNWKLILPEANLIIKCSLAFFFLIWNLHLFHFSNKLFLQVKQGFRTYRFNRKPLALNVVKIYVGLACLPLPLDYKQTERNIIIFKLQYQKERERNTIIKMESVYFIYILIGKLNKLVS